MIRRAIAPRGHGDSLVMLDKLAAVEIFLMNDTLVTSLDQLKGLTQLKKEPENPLVYVSRVVRYTSLNYFLS